MSRKIKIYCDTPSYLSWVKKIEKDDLAEIVSFPYENKNRKIKNKSIPTNNTWNQSNLGWSEAKYRWKDCSPSNKFNDIKIILKGSGQDTSVDAQHLDSAYKSNCDIFLTNDITDIVTKRNSLESLLGIKIFDAKNEEKQAIVFITKLEKQKISSPRSLNVLK